ncbi:hypothetical protein [Croceibacterium ferulae]|uniref:hypothetical protein n=1 Tax=Croceibacterium ferulae TaxID=1854641 RepID=UPI000F86BCCF|nr:hypothetical protein [Croceibacterium ferulae]
MSRLEENVRLPEGASKLSEYARYYADAGRGEIVAAYLIPFEHELAPGEGCEEMMKDFSSREVPCPDQKSPWSMPAGQRRWLDDRLDLPVVSDGGCIYVEIIFDKATAAMKRAECNGLL